MGTPMDGMMAYYHQSWANEDIPALRPIKRSSGRWGESDFAEATSEMTVQPPEMVTQRIQGRMEASKQVLN